jgi:HEAT repeat protein
MSTIFVVIAALSAFDFADHFRALVSSKVVVPTITAEDFIVRVAPETDAEAFERCVKTLEAILAVPRSAPDFWGQYDDDEYRQLSAADELAGRGPAAAAAIPVLVRTLKSINPCPARAPAFSTDLMHIDAPGAARKALVSIGKAAVPELRKAVHDEDALTRVHAARALWELGDNAADVLPVLRAALRDEKAIEQDTMVRLEARAALCQIAVSSFE